ncbi:unnamed protein product, partial [Heterotrigona itama]
IKSLYFNSNWSVCTVGMKWVFTTFQQRSITLSRKQSNGRSLWYRIATVTGHDLWLENVRGNRYSRRNLYMTTIDPDMIQIWIFW